MPMLLTIKTPAGEKRRRILWHVSFSPADKASVAPQRPYMCAGTLAAAASTANNQAACPPRIHFDRASRIC
jgi:hypothetical protein